VDDIPGASAAAAAAAAVAVAMAMFRARSETMRWYGFGCSTAIPVCAGAPPSDVLNPFDVWGSKGPREETETAEVAERVGLSIGGKRCCLRLLARSAAAVVDGRLVVAAAAVDDE